MTILLTIFLAIAVGIWTWEIQKNAKQQKEQETTPAQPSREYKAEAIKSINHFESDKQYYRIEPYIDPREQFKKWLKNCEEVNKVMQRKEVA